MVPGPSDEEIERRLAAQPQEAWDDLWAAVDALDGCADRFRWHGGHPIFNEVADGDDKTVRDLPYVRYSDEVERVLRLLARLDVVFAFEYPAWDEGRAFAGGNGMAEAPVADAARFLSAIVLSDRFCDGTIAAALEDGGLDAAIARLRQWHSQHA